MSDSAGLGLRGYHSYQFYVRDLERFARFHEERLGFHRVAATTEAFEREQRMSGLVLMAGKNIRLVALAPLEPGSAAGRYLEVHPEGIPFLNFLVRDVEAAHAFLLGRKAPFLWDGILSERSDTGVFRQIAIATPLGDLAFRFVEDRDFGPVPPGFRLTWNEGPLPANRFGFHCIDHATSNARALIPIVAFYERVLGFERFWDVEFHTKDVDPDAAAGSGLRSTVMWDPASQIKFATNEPIAPDFENSQIAIFVHENRGAGCQHIAFSVPEIIPSVHALAAGGLRFLDAPDRYYERLPARIADRKMGAIREPLDRLKEARILLDGRDGGYLLQLFTTDLASQIGAPEAGPFFYEVIQREGDRGFGEGNFRALFESIEREQEKVKKSVLVPAERL